MDIQLSINYFHAMKDIWGRRRWKKGRIAYLGSYLLGFYQLIVTKPLALVLLLYKKKK